MNHLMALSSLCKEESGTQRLSHTYHGGTSHGASGAKGSTDSTMASQVQHRTCCPTMRGSLSNSTCHTLLLEARHQHRTGQNALSARCSRTNPTYFANFSVLREFIGQFKKQGTSSGQKPMNWPKQQTTP